MQASAAAPSIAAASAGAAAAASAPPTRTEPSAGTLVAASSPRTKPPTTHTPAAATQGRKPKVKRFFTGTSRGKNRQNVSRTRLPGITWRPPPVGALPPQFIPAEPSAAHPCQIAEPYVASHRDRQGLRDRQTHSRRSIFPGRKTHPGRDSSGGADGAGDAGGCGQERPCPIGPPSQHVSRIMPQQRQSSFARISKVSPWQTGQRGMVMGTMVAPPASFQPAMDPTRTRISSFGPWAPSTRIRSMSPVRLGPVMKESMLGMQPSCRAFAACRASASVATI